jgi:nucleotide sugar dehydrogenase
MMGARPPAALDETPGDRPLGAPAGGPTREVSFDVVVIGLGYVGLPLVTEAAAVGLRVAGYEVDPSVVESLRAGRSHIDIVSDEDVRRIRAQGFVATSDEAVLGDTQVVVICVPTPLTPDGGPDLTAVRAAAAATARHLAAGMLVVLESTTYPGTTEEVICPILELGSGLTTGRDLHVAFSPERIDPGNRRFGLANTPKIVGGVTPGCTEAALAFYGRFVETVVTARGAREAEMAKLIENTYRQVNIALVNEMAMFSHELGIDLWDAIECAATKPFGFQAFYPGPGVGGHCIPIDPGYLAHKVRTLGVPFRFVDLAQEINARMSGYVVERVVELLNRHGRALNGASVLLLGVTYKPDVMDQRESPARPIARKLRARGAVLAYHDPHVADWDVDGYPVRLVHDLDTELRTADVTVLLQDHSAYDAFSLARGARLFFDTRGRVRELRSRTVEVL